ncbi:MAG: cmk [Clostridiales bacterium]|jgi:cytidylate kinase|nr:cmk [Clostridiales bacterium]
MYSIAIDGPAGAGKSTIAKNIAKELGFIYIDTGAMYRAIALFLIRNNIPSDDEKKISEAVKKVNIEIEYVKGVQQVILNGENISELIRTNEVSKMASISSVYPDVRLKLVDIQRCLAEKVNVVMDGRDIGTYVLPEATLKIYLTASVEERAKRRYNEYVNIGVSANLENIKKEIEERDFRDMNRDFAPLKKAEDAVVVDSSFMNIEDVKDYVINKFDLVK